MVFAEVSKLFYLSIEMDRFVTVSKQRTTQKSILAYAVETPRGTFTHRPSPPSKRSLPAEKRRPGRPSKKRPRKEDESEWHAAIECERRLAVSASEAYEAAYFSHYGAKKAIERAPKKFQASYTAERRFEIREYHLSYPEASYKDIADAFGMPKTTIFDIIKRQPSGEPARGRGNKKGAGRPLSYPQETEEQLVCF